MEMLYFDRKRDTTLIEDTIDEKRRREIKSQKMVNTFVEQVHNRTKKRVSN